MYLPQEKIKIWMSGKGIVGNIFGAIIGSVTPFCACSTIPLTLGFLEAGIPFAAVMSFVISSPPMLTINSQAFSKIGLGVYLKSNSLVI